MCLADGVKQFEGRIARKAQVSNVQNETFPWHWIMAWRQPKN